VSSSYVRVDPDQSVAGRRARPGAPAAAAPGRKALGSTICPLGPFGKFFIISPIPGIISKTFPSDPIFKIPAAISFYILGANTGSYNIFIAYF
jgi:hypothetical protein